MDKEVMRGEWLKRWRDAVGTLNAKEILHERRGGVTMSRDMVRGRMRFRGSDRQFETRDKRGETQ